MNDPLRTATARRLDNLTLLALAAGLAFGHVVEAMAERAAIGGQTIVVALVFLGAASASTVCALLALAAGERRSRHERITGWVAAIGAGVLAAIGPGLL
ncbi:MAG: hypothetical protein ABIO71_07140 [Caldimonas sp.]